jgi:hypothetical protein
MASLILPFSREVETAPTHLSIRSGSPPREGPFMAAAHDRLLGSRPERTFHSAPSPAQGRVRGLEVPPDARRERNGGSIPHRLPRRAGSGLERRHSPEAEARMEGPFRSGCYPARVCAQGQRRSLPASGSRNGRSIPHHVPPAPGPQPWGDAGLPRGREGGMDVPCRTARAPCGRLHRERWGALPGPHHAVGAAAAALSGRARRGGTSGEWWTSTWCPRRGRTWPGGW